MSRATVNRPRPASGGKSNARRREAQRQRRRQRRLHQAEVQRRLAGPAPGVLDRLIVYLDHWFRSLAGTSAEAWVTAAGVVLVSVLATTAKEPSTLGPRMAVLLLLTALGLPRLVQLAVDSPLRWPARAAAGFCGWALLSAAVSHVPLIGFFGYSERGTGMLFWAAVASLWALGTGFTEPGRRVLRAALGLVVTVEALAVLVEVAASSSTGWRHFMQGLPGLQLVNGQPVGTLDSAASVAAVLVAGIALLSAGAARPTRRWWALVAGLGFVAQLTGERLPLVLAGLVAAAVAVTVGWRPALRLAAAVGGGIGLGFAFEQIPAIAHGSLSTVSHLAPAGAPTVWDAALRAVGHHLLVGSGPGQALSTVQTLLHAPVQHGALVDDAWSLVLEVAVTTGVVGLALLVAWFVPVVRRAHGPLALAGLVVLAVLLVHPLDVTLPALAFVALGAATAGPVGAAAWRPAMAEADEEPVTEAAAPPGRVGRRRPAWWAAAVLGVPALVIGVQMVVGSAFEWAGVAAQSPPRAARATDWVWMWADAPAAVAVTDQAEQIPSATRYDRIWLARDGIDPDAWVTAGQIAEGRGKDSVAAADFRHAVALDPWSAGGYRGLVDLDSKGSSTARLVADFTTLSRIEASGADRRELSCIHTQLRHHATVSKIVAACSSTAISQQILNAINGQTLYAPTG